MEFSIQDKNLLLDVQREIPGIVIELKYASADNFTGQIIYTFTHCLLHLDAIERLRKVQAVLQKQGLGLKIWDGFRPLTAQKKLWEIIPDEKYVANPAKGGRHTRGTAVDCTLVDQQGKELPMPSAFDDFSEKAHSSYRKGSPESLKNRDLLRRVMEENGFVGYENEWWHFDLQDWQNYPALLD